jgi:hypothetical protein
MRTALLLLAAAALASAQRTPPPAHAEPFSPFAGRWDLTVGESGGWLEFLKTPSGPKLRIVPRVGGVKTVPTFEMEDGRLTFSNTEWFGKWEPVRYDLTIRDRAIAGTATRESGPVLPVAGVRAPDLRRNASSWGPAIRLSDDLSGWKVMSPTKPGNWTLRDGVLSNARSGPNLRTIEEFEDFRLDLEFNCPDGSNSGIFLRGRYELQIEEEPDNRDPLGRTGSIYQFLGADVPRKPGQWRTLSIALIGRSVTVTLDGATILGGRQIPGPTGGSFNSREGEPGPIILQGDHGAVQYRNIVLRRALP